MRPTARRISGRQVVCEAGKPSGGAQPRCNAPAERSIQRRRAKRRQSDRTQPVGTLSLPPSVSQHYTATRTSVVLGNLLRGRRNAVTESYGTDGVDNGL